MDPFADDGSYKGVRRQLVDSCFLVRHPQGDMLLDAGVGDQFAGTSGVTYMPGVVAHVPVTLVSQLKQLGVAPAGIRILAFSHEHIDHIGNANLFSNATWILNGREHRWTIKHDGRGGQPPAPLAESVRAKVKTISTDYDIFGDGTVRLIQAPGHTPGHQVLFVRSNVGSLILAGDLWHSYANFAHDRVPRFNTSREETLASIQRIRKLAKKADARIILGHSAEDFHPGAVSGAHEIHKEVGSPRIAVPVVADAGEAQ